MPFKPGFDLKEAEAFLGMISKIEPPSVPGLPVPPIPAHWKELEGFPSPDIMPYHNMWSLYKDSSFGDGPERFALLIRGTVYKASSIMEDLLAMMVPATGSIETDSGLFEYTLARDPRAGVHYGFLLGMLYLVYDNEHGILARLKKIAHQGAEIFIVGHSQGAALATLLRSYLHYSNHFLDMGFTYKTYLFAQPKPGNDYYANDFASLVNPPDMVYRVTNSRDWVPQVPFTVQSLGSTNEITLVGPVQKIGRWILGVVAWWIDTLLNFQRRRRLRRSARGLDKLLYVQEKQTQGAGKRRGKAIAAGSSDGPGFVESLNYVNCGILVALRGRPEEKPDDLFWHHHAQMYYELLSAR